MLGPSSSGCRGAPRRKSGPLGRRLRPRDAWLWVGRHPGQGRAPPMIPPHPRALSLHTPEGSPTPRTQAASLQDKEKDGGTSGQNFISILCSLFAQSCPILCDPMDCSPPGSSVHGILQARILKRVATLFSRGSSQPRDQTQVSCTAGGFFTV